MSKWNPWHGCTRVSPGCLHCYVYRIDGRHERDASRVVKTSTFYLPQEKTRQGEYKLTAAGGLVYTCFSSDFFHPAADEWRIEAWEMMRQRQDLIFFFITKRPERFYVNLPADWGDGYSNVHICVTCENEAMARQRLPIYLSLPIRHKSINCEPLLGPINLASYLALAKGEIGQVMCGGESGPGARPCHYEWVLDIRQQCVMWHTKFRFHSTGACFVKDGKVYKIPRPLQHSQAKKAGLNYEGCGDVRVAD